MLTTFISIAKQYVNKETHDYDQKGWIHHHFAYIKTAEVTIIKNNHDKLKWPCIAYYKW